jgi:hypothetical protein
MEINDGLMNTVYDKDVVKLREITITVGFLK